MLKPWYLMTAAVFASVLIIGSIDTKAQAASNLVLVGAGDIDTCGSLEQRKRAREFNLRGSANRRVANMSNDRKAAV